ncbi:MAG: 50S ribosomal protein L21 [Proteobacteria bacterium]|nr:50S ribosomal protein L21 [Pseudomonadota bacterium]
MFAVIKTGGKQYRVTDGDVIVVEKLAGEPGSSIKFDQILMLGGSGETQTVGTPLIANATVTGEVLEQSRADKIIVFKKKRRQGYKRKAGHRQDQTVLRIVDINGSGKSAAKAAAPKEADAPAKDDASAEAAAPAKKKAAAATKAKAPAKKKSAAASKAKAPKSED